MDKILLDGAMGTRLLQAGMETGQLPEVWGMTHPEVLERIHREYVEAGAEIILADTFCANPLKLKGSGWEAEEVIQSNVRTAGKAAGGRARVALDIGPLGKMMEPLGDMTFEEAYRAFARMVRAGAAAGADLVFIETMSDLSEARAAVLAAREHSALPVFVTMTFEKNGRTFSGTEAGAMAVTLDRLGVDALGVNCSLGPAEVRPVVERMLALTDKPLIVKPNAGLPDPETGRYNLDAAEFARQMAVYPALGVRYLGGCCGTGPEYISALRGLGQVAGRKAAARDVLCSKSRVVPLSGVRIIGERINPTGKKRFQQALREGDLDYIMARAVEQEEAGADVLDINVGLPGIDEKRTMEQVVRAVQSVTDLPVMIDSSSPEVIEAGLRAACGRAVINSVNGEEEKLRAILPLARRYGAAVVGLCLDEKGLPAGAEERLQIARRIVSRAAQEGLAPEDLLIDCLTMTAASAQSQAMETLRAVTRVRRELGTHACLGVSNISFGLPCREILTASFLTMAMYAGLDMPIVNPNRTEILDAVACFRALEGEDQGFESYTRRFALRRGQEQAAAAAPAPEERAEGLLGAVLRGMAGETERLTRALLEDTDPMEVVEKHLIPALDEVGDRYEKGTLFLPQLLSASSAAQRGFAAVKARMTESGRNETQKGPILLATVEGDIHDIGKNIVKVVLENYGYTVVDLGKDVPAERVALEVARLQAPMLGLSALMTTTVPAMEKTIRLVREKCPGCFILVGGAVLTPEHAARIGADAYAGDAKAAADAARRVLG